MWRLAGKLWATRSVTSNAGGLQAGDLVRVVGEQADLGIAEMAQHLRRRFEDPLVCVETEAQIGLHRIETVLLQAVGP